MITLERTRLNAAADGCSVAAMSRLLRPTDRPIQLSVSECCVAAGKSVTVAIAGGSRGICQCATLNASLGFRPTLKHA